MFNPYTYQKELMDKYSAPNYECDKRIAYLLAQGVSITNIGTVYGAHSNHITYFMSNGEILEKVKILPLNWIPDPLRVY